MGIKKSKIEKSGLVWLESRRTERIFFVSEFHKKLDMLLLEFIEKGLDFVFLVRFDQKLAKIIDFRFFFQTLIFLFQNFKSIFSVMKVQV